LTRLISPIGELAVMHDELRLTWSANKLSWHNRIPGLELSRRIWTLGGLLGRFRGRRIDDVKLLRRLIGQPIDTLIGLGHEIDLRCHLSGDDVGRLYRLTIELQYRGSEPVVLGRLLDVSHEEIDELTGLRHLSDPHGEVADWMKQAKKTGQVFGLLCMDADNFRAINGLGHSVGDAALRAAGQSMATLRRSRGILPIRTYKGDEFTFLIMAPSLVEFYARVGDILEAVNGLEIRHDDGNDSRIIPVTFTHAYGIPEPRESAVALLIRVDRAMMAAKKS
jgi:diguanylate cyclase (GGDEF)-like protein